MKIKYETVNVEIVIFEKEEIETANESVGVVLPGDTFVDIDGLI